MYFHLTVNITFYLLLLGVITAFPAPAEDEGKVVSESDSVTKIEESLSETTIEPNVNKEETSQASSVEHAESKDATSEENHNDNSKKPEPDSKNNDKSIKDTTEHTSKKHTTVKPKTKPAVVDKDKKDKRVGATDKGHRGKATKAPHQKSGGGRLAVSSTKHKHDSIPKDDSSSYEQPKKQKYLPRKNAPGLSHQKQTMSIATDPEIIILLDKISKQQMEMQELLKQMGMRQANMEGSIYHIARSFPVGSPDY